MFLFTDCSGLKGRTSQRSLCIVFGVLTLSLCVDLRCALCTRSLFTFGHALAQSPVLLLSVQGFLHLCVVIQSLSHRVDNMLLQIQFETLLLMCPCVVHSLKICRVHTHFTSKQGKRLASSMKRGRRMNLMKPVWDEGLVTLSRSMKGVTGRPSNFSTSLWGQKRRNYDCVRVFHSLCLLYSLADWPGCKTPAGDSPARAPPPPWAGPHWICRSLWSESSSAARTTWEKTHWCRFSDHDGIKPNPPIR